jgi:hypothetical protein
MDAEMTPNTRRTLRAFYYTHEPYFLGGMFGLILTIALGALIAWKG